MRMTDKFVQARTELKLLRRPRSSGPKIVCIGYNKTGTTSVGKALQLLGFYHLTFHRPHWRAYQNGKTEKLLRVMERVDSVDDLPWLKKDFFPLIDNRFPGSRFIYLERDVETWKKSLTTWTMKVTNRAPDLEGATAAFIDHKNFVDDYFANRPDDLLRLNVRDPEAFEKLARFVGRTKPEENFPHANSS